MERAEKHEDNKASGNYNFHLVHSYELADRYSFFLKKEPQTSRTVVKIAAKFKSLNDEEKIKIKYFECGIIKLANGKLHIGGKGFEDEERDLIAKKELSEKKLNLLSMPLFSWKDK